MNLRAGASHVLIACSLTLVAVYAAPACRAIVVSGEVDGTWSPDQNPVILETDCRIPAGQTLYILPGARILMSPGTSLIVQGSLVAMGLPKQPITFAPAAPMAGPWRAVAISGTGSANLRDCALRGGGAAQPTELMGALTVEGGTLSLVQCDISASDSNGVYLRTGTLAVDGVRLRDNGGARPTDAGIHIASGAVTLQTTTGPTTIEGSPFGIYNEDLVPVNAGGIWWGSSTGPQHATNILGLGASVSDDVHYAGFLTDNPTPLPGDVNQDGICDLQDVAVLARIAAGILPASQAQMGAGDVVADGALDIVDAAALARVILTEGP